LICICSRRIAAFQRAAEVSGCCSLRVRAQQIAAAVSGGKRIALTCGKTVHIEDIDKSAVRNRCADRGSCPDCRGVFGLSCQCLGVVADALNAVNLHDELTDVLHRGAVGMDEVEIKIPVAVVGKSCFGIALLPGIVGIAVEKAILRTNFLQIAAVGRAVE